MPCRPGQRQPLRLAFALHWVAFAAAWSGPSPAAADATQGWGVRGQATYIWQAKPAFASAYAGERSLQAGPGLSDSFSATVALGWRPAPFTEAYVDAELVQGKPLSNMTGLGGLPNGELQKSGSSQPQLYRARLFLRRTWALTDTPADAESVEAGLNQLAGSQARDRLVLSLGNLAVTDIFDPNPYAHDARSQFLNWSLLTHGAYDFAADSRGYSWGAALEWRQGDWRLRGGRFAMPAQSNGAKLDGQIWRQFGDQLELEHAHRWLGWDGSLRALLWRNVARYARFDDALAAAGGGVPSLNGVRRRQAKSGWGLAWEQSLPASLGVFARLAGSDGVHEPFAFAAIDGASSAGLSWGGAAWGRPRDTVGLALARNTLGPQHRQFLAAGGQDYFLGDGRLRYAAERIAEAYVAADLGQALTLTLDWQRVSAPGYNADRGPARFVGLRLHADF